MSDPDIPYLPISEFDASLVTKEFSECKSEESSEDKLDLKSLSGNDFPEEVTLILLGMGMEKYIKLFKKIPLDSFLNINESELQDIGITNEDDRKTIINNLSLHQKNKDNLIVSENHIDDLNIIKNVHYQLLLLQNYCAYVELQMRKQTLTDYPVDSEDTACTFLKVFSECALTQSQMISSRIHQENDSETLIKKLLKMYDLTLSEEFQKALVKKEKKRLFFKVMIFIGCSSLVLLTGKYLMRKS